jgi:cytochrome c peroxidase
MSSHRARLAAAAILIPIATAALAAAPTQQLASSALVISRDSSGISGTYRVGGAIDTRNPFFKVLGTNGRSCATCHLLTQAMSFTPEYAQEKYDQTRGSDPLFAGVDGANCPNVARSDRAGHSQILRHGLIRVAITLPASTEYSISVAHDPYGCALTTDPKTGGLTVSVYRRPLPGASLPFLSAVMWDGRETVAPLTTPASLQANLRTDLAHQAVDATLGHAQASVTPDDATVQSIVNFELSLFSAQVYDERAGWLHDRGGLGGPVNLSEQDYYAGINDSLGGDPLGLDFNPASMSLYAAWLRPTRDRDFAEGARRADIAAGEQIFNTAPMTIANVRGLNDNAALNRPSSLVGHCSTCHDAPNIGDHSLPLPLDIGVAHSTNPSFEPDPVITAAVGELSGARDLPVYLISGCPNPFNPGTPASFYTTDPGKALISGKCADFNRLKGPILRGLAARAPYFHNGSAANLTEVVDFYNQRFQMKLTAQQKRQLAAFLGTL